MQNQSAYNQCQNCHNNKGNIPNIEEELISCADFGRGMTKSELLKIQHCAAQEEITKTYKNDNKNPKQ